jgi:hypothetical protein
MARVQERESLVTGLIIERPLCMHCITTKAAATVIEVETAFDSIRRNWSVSAATRWDPVGAAAPSGLSIGSTGRR